MDVFDRPGIKPSDVLAMADQYSQILVTELVQINKKYPHAEKLSDRERKFLGKAPRTATGELRGLTPESARFPLKSVFCAYIADRFTIEPGP